MLHQHRRCASGRKRRLPGEHLISEDAKRVEIAPSVDFPLARRLLWGHVGRRADRHAGRREAAVAPTVHRARDAEVGDHGTARHRIEQDVVGLDVAVHHAAIVRVRQRVGDIA